MFRFNDKRVYADYADDQYIVLNYINGEYYSFDRIPSAVLQALVSGAGINDIGELLTERFGLDSHADDRLGAFITKLTELEILEPEDDYTDDPAAGDAGREEAAEILKKTLMELQDPEMPELVCDVYTDVADLLLMDPIHEVDENAGWPARKPD